MPAFDFLMNVYKFDYCRLNTANAIKQTDREGKNPVSDS
ncbi:hypothetical protein PM8797T_11991 [Gimesia maris DSM 8797]|nr:hypothetical protein PM8797T_11991 [Gimesia maris DSM 8797]|tara:strand:+ start:120285 stop:120401 length:117 start_codon:yes stop_codon:yes gene_type:complete